MRGVRKTSPRLSSSVNANRVQVAGLWIAACSHALALLRTVFDDLEVMGR